MKSVLITGGSKGIGLGLVRSLLEEGWKVTTVSRSFSEELQLLSKKHQDLLQWWQADLSDPDQVRQIGNRKEIFQGFDAFIANAAIGTDGLLSLLSESQIRKTIETNLTSTILLTRQVIKGMLQNMKGSIIFVSSIAAVVGFRGLSVYSATKAALLGFCRALVREYGERGIRFNVVLPGFIETEMSSSIPFTERSRILRRIPVKRFGTVEDVVNLIRFLLSEQASYINGAEFVVDGGIRA